MRAGWVTDPHLNFLRPLERAGFYARLRDQHLDVLLLGGDIGEADSVGYFLSELESELRIPVYFVLGNHDFYRGSIREVRAAIAEQAASSSRLHWLPTSGVVPLPAETALVGHDSWADGRVGDFFNSQVLLNDYVLIDELRNPSKQKRYERLNALGDEAAAFLDNRVREALPRFQHILVLTHVPPFREACWHEGRISDSEYLPHFACRAVGERLAAIMLDHPGHSMTVLCGHTHSGGVAHILDNLTVLTGGAEYGRPALQQILEVE
jgi:3',5'-cyclic AMP phosphodiesterase CpdA